MKIGFFASGISPHISPICDELYRRYGEDFRFFGTDKEPIEAMFIMGAGNLHNEKNYFYNVNYNDEYMKMSICWAIDADVAIIGCSNCYHYMDIRFSHGNKLTLKLRERLFKDGFYDVNDEKLQNKIRDKIKKHIDKNLFFLCAGTYATYDFVTVGVPIERIIKWGYFPQNSPFIFEDLKRNYSSTMKLIWFGRFVREKLALNAIIATEKVLSLGYDVHLSIIGYGEEECILKKYVFDHSLYPHIEFMGAMNESEIRNELRKSHIFIMTSNYEEGWGVVVNEAMSEGCIPVVSYATGASDMLIEGKYCGRLFLHNEIDDLVLQIKYLIDNRSMLHNMSRNSYDHIVHTWNAKVAAERLIKCIENINQNKPLPRYEMGPCGKISIYKNEYEVKRELEDRRKRI